MQIIEEVIEFIRSEVAGCKAMKPEEVDVDLALAEDIKLVGDDFTEIDYLLCERFGVQTEDADYKRFMTIRDWAHTVVRKIT